MKIMIVGNCQSSGFGSVFKKMLPNASISSYTISKKNLPRIESGVSESDLIFSQGIRSHTDVNLQVEEYLSRVDGVCNLPRVFFTGYFPDITFIPGLTAGNSVTPANTQSAIAIAGFLAGRSPKDTAKLFNKFVYASLGYFDAYHIAREVLLGHLRELNLDMSSRFDDWTADGPFMYAFNHPSIRVIADIAYQAAQNAALTPIKPNLETLPDKLKMGLNWPIFPEIAENLGFEGSMRITRSREGKELDIDWGEYLEISHAIYSGLDREQLLTPQVQKVLDLL